jgi:hypothetical protein
MVAKAVARRPGAREGPGGASVAGRCGPGVRAVATSPGPVVLGPLVAILHAPEHPHEEDHQQSDIHHADADLEEPPRGGHGPRW